MTDNIMLHGDCREMLHPDYINGEPATRTPFYWFPAPPDGIDMVLTDPPYGAAYKSTFGKDPKAREKYQAEIADDDTVEKAIDSFHETMMLMLPHLAPVCELYVFSEWHVAPSWQKYLESLAEHGLELSQLIIWEKGYPGLGDFTYNWGCGHEFIYYLKKGKRPVPYRRSGILHVDKVRPGTNVHPTQKPLELLDILIQYSTDPGQFIFDPYAGSGSTVLAARDAGRSALGIEIDKGYYDTACNRLREGGLLSL